MLLKIDRKTLFRTSVTGEKSGSTPNTEKTAGELESTSRERRSADEKLLGGDTKVGDSC